MLFIIIYYFSWYCDSGIEYVVVYPDNMEVASQKNTAYTDLDEASN